MKILFTLLAFSCLIISCNQERNEKLEFEKGVLERKVVSLEEQIAFLNGEKESLETVVSEMQQDMEVIRNHADRASSNASSAVFWARSGNTFFYESDIESMAKNFDAIVRIASKY